jgi:hypothetical protein
MINANLDQPLFDPSVALTPAVAPGGNGMFMNQPGGMYPVGPQMKVKSSSPPRIGGLHLPALILLAFSWLLHTLATFLPYWSTYSGYSGSRAGEEVR